MIYGDRKSSSLEKKAQKFIGKTFSISQIDASILQTFTYEYPSQEIVIEHATEEFTCICPFSGLPDFARLTIEYVPAGRCVELKSLKYYLYSFRQVKSFNEHVINRILQDLVKLLAPRRMKITGQFSIRGGMKNTVAVSFP
jgi:7-cyano-7-deazaguanine reductase